MSLKKSRFTMKELMEAGVHFGHRTGSWNPKMREYIYGSNNGIHIMDLRQTAVLLESALEKLKQVAKNNGRILFVGTKRQVSEPLREEAERSGQYNMTYKWRGGGITNWNTTSKSVESLKKLEERIKIEESKEVSDLTKKEKLELVKKYEKMNLILGGIRNMGGIPDILVVIDTNREKIAIKEAVKFGIPVIAIIDSNSDPDNIDYPIPGNDDSTRSIKLYCRLFSDAILEGMEESLMKSGADKPVDGKKPIKSKAIDFASFDKDDEKPNADDGDDN